MPESAGRDSSTGASSGADGSEPDLFSDPAGEPTLRTRSRDDDVALQGLPAESWCLPGEASVGGASDGDDSLDSYVKTQFRRLVTHVPDIQAREIDPKLFKQVTQSLLEDTSVTLTHHPEIKAVHRRLGAGSFGEVFHCTMKDSRSEVAVKVLRQDTAVSQQREAKMLSELKHGSLVQFHCLLRGPPHALVLELCAGGSLANLLHGKMPSSSCLANLGWRPRARASMDIVSAVEYLHTQHIVHRDIKAGNALLAAPVDMPAVDLPPVKLGDLGLAREVGCHMTPRTGTRRYMAPEVASSNPYAKPADIYSCGLFLFEMMSGEVPFKDFESDSVVLAVATGRRPDPSDVRGPRHLVGALAQVLEACWADDPSARPSASCLARLLQPLALDECACQG